jgi:hypothetical protein
MCPAQASAALKLAQSGNSDELDILSNFNPFDFYTLFNRLPLNLRNWMLSLLADTEMDSALINPIVKKNKKRRTSFFDIFDPLEQRYQNIVWMIFLTDQTIRVTKQFHETRIKALIKDISTVAATPHGGRVHLSSRNEQVEVHTKSQRKLLLQTLEHDKQHTQTTVEKLEKVGQKIPKHIQRLKSKTSTQEADEVTKQSVLEDIETELHTDIQSVPGLWHNIMSAGKKLGYLGLSAAHLLSRPFRKSADPSAHSVPPVSSSFSSYSYRPTPVPPPAAPVYREPAANYDWMSDQVAANINSILNDPPTNEDTESEEQTEKGPVVENPHPEAA